MPTSVATLVRTIRSVPLPAVERPHVVGVDDWALRKGRTCGTIVVDLERRRPIDLLPDRSAETWAAWLRREPQIQFVARDRSTEYARGTTLGAPEAVQVADHWHLLLNTHQMIERWLARVHPRLKLLPPVGTPIPSIRRTKASPRTPAEALVRAAAVGRWEGLYDDVRRRRAAGQSLRQITRETGLARATVRKYAFAERFPRHGRRGRSAASSILISTTYTPATARAVRTLSSFGASFAVSASLVPRSRSGAGCPSGVRDRPRPRSSARRCRWLSRRPRRHHPRRSPHRSSCRGISCATRATRYWRASTSRTPLQCRPG